MTVKELLKHSYACQGPVSIFIISYNCSIKSTINALNLTYYSLICSIYITKLHNAVNVP